MKNLIVQLRPISNSSEYDETDGINDDEREYNEGYYIEDIEVEPGNEFDIEDDVKATVLSEDSEYKYIDEDEPGLLEHYKVGDTISLETGKYLFHADGITIERKGW